jgi:hypothetical protein
LLVVFGLDVGLDVGFALMMLDPCWCRKGQSWPLAGRPHCLHRYTARGFPVTVVVLAIIGSGFLGDEGDTIISFLEFLFG